MKTTQCFCSNSINATDKVSDSLCSTNCTGDSSEKCGNGTTYQNVFDLRTVYGTICPSNVFAEEGSLCCPERSSFRLIDQSILDFFVILLPFSFSFLLIPISFEMILFIFSEQPFLSIEYKRSISKPSNVSQCLACD